MASEEAASRYAQAAFAIAVDDGTIDQWRRDLADIATVLADSELAMHLADDRIPVAERQALIERALDIAPKALNLAKLLIAKGRSQGAGFVASAFERMADEHEGRIQAEVTSAIDLTQEQVAAIAQHLSEVSGRQVTVRLTVDPAIMGGLIVRVGDQLTDGSVRTRLRRLQRQLESAA